MVIKSEQFKEIAKEYQTLSKYFVRATIHINYHYDNSYSPVYNTTYTAMSFKNVEKLHEYSKLHPIALQDLNFSKYISNLHSELIVKLRRLGGDEKVLTPIEAAHANKYKTLKLVPSEVPYQYQPDIISRPPLEFTEGNYTYRFLAGLNGVTSAIALNIISRNDEPLYDYLDEGFYVKSFVHQVGRKKIYKMVAANAYDVHVAHIFAMCTADFKLIELLQNGCFINVHSAEMTRLKLFKKMSDAGKRAYQPMNALIENDYKKNSTLLVVGKLVEGEIEKTTINNIVFTKSSAVYEQVSIEADDLLETLYADLNFNGEFDIYGVIAIYAARIEKKLNKFAPDEPAKAAEDDHAAAEVLPAPAIEAGEKTSLPVFKINNISITPAVSRTFQRYINDVRINKDEISKAIHRASCHRTTEDYKLFLKSISRMSIKWHDVVANGLQFKIHSTISRQEYQDAAPSIDAPAIKLCIDPTDKQFKLQVDKDRKVRVNLSKLIKKAETLNKRTDAKTFYPKSQLGYYRRAEVRDYNWCASELAGLLLDCCTFSKTVKNEDGIEKTTEETLITREDIVALLSVVNEQKKAIIEKSKEFLNTAVKLTNATSIEFLGKKAYHVKGVLREYAVVIENAKVYDYATKQYRCIVNDKHYAGAGYDDIAARLLALKNDSMMQEHIGTLKGAAQPGAENVHNYQPDRDVAEQLDELVSNVIEKRNNNQTV
jgi:hypothetical protein